MSNALDQLRKLRNAHDQTMRTKAIAILYGRETINGITPTRRFLDDQIRQLEVKEAEALAQP